MLRTRKGIRATDTVGIYTQYDPKKEENKKECRCQNFQAADSREPQEGKPKRNTSSESSDGVNEKND